MEYCPQVLAHRVLPPRKVQACAKQQAEKGQLEVTFGYAGSLDQEPPFAKFDISDSACLRAGGFQHGQVVRDRDGREYLAVGVRPENGVPRLWFQPKDLGRRGAGFFPSASAECLRARLCPAGGRPLSEATPEDFNEFEGTDGEVVLLCCKCRLPVGDFVYADDGGKGNLHGECMAQLMLDKITLEEEKRLKMDADTKDAARAKWGLAWGVEQMPSSTPQLAAALGCEVAHDSSMYCLVMHGDDRPGAPRALSVEETHQPAGAVNLEYLALTLRVRLLEGTEPYFSLDPIPPEASEAPVASLKHRLQRKRFEPAWLAETSAGDVLFQSDYYLKEVSMGEHQQPILGMRSVFDYAGSAALEGDWCGREWFVVKEAGVRLSADNVLIPHVLLGVEARETHFGQKGMEDKPVTRPDHPLVKYAQEFSHNFELIAERRSVIFHLRELAKAAVLAKFLMESGTFLEEAWFNQPTAPSCGSSTPLEVPQFWNERFSSRIQLDGGKIVDADRGVHKGMLGIYGGISFGLEQVVETGRFKPAFGGRPQRVTAVLRDLSATRAAPLRAPPTPAEAGAALRGVDLRLDRFDLAKTSEEASEEAGAAWGQLAYEGTASSRSGDFWSSVEGESGPIPLRAEERGLLMDVFNPSLSDRREEGSRFIPPDASASHVRALRQLVEEEELVRARRKATFLSKDFAPSRVGEFFPSAWAPHFEIQAAASPLRDVEERVGRPVYMQSYGIKAPVSLEELHSSSPVFDRRAEDGMRFRIYRVGDLEARTTEERGGREILGVVFLRHDAASAVSAGALRQLFHTDVVVRVTEYVKAVASIACIVPGQLPFQCHLVLETEGGGMVVAELLPDGSTRWEENPPGLRRCNSNSKIIRIMDCARGLSLGDARSLHMQVLSQVANEPTTTRGKRYAQAMFAMVVGGGTSDVRSGFWRKSSNWVLTQASQPLKNRKREVAWGAGCDQSLVSHEELEEWGNEDAEAWEGNWDDSWDYYWQDSWDSEWQRKGASGGAPAIKVQAILPSIHLRPHSKTRKFLELQQALGLTDKQVAQYFMNFTVAELLGNPDAKSHASTGGLLWQSSLNQGS